jgi:hypothetical protein
MRQLPSCQSPHLFPLPSAPFRTYLPISRVACDIEIDIGTARCCRTVPVHKNMFIILYFFGYKPFPGREAPSFLHTHPYMLILFLFSFSVLLRNTFLSLLLVLLSRFFPPVLQIQDPGSVAFLTPGSGTGNSF